VFTLGEIFYLFRSELVAKEAAGVGDVTVVPVDGRSGGRDLKMK
jgi:hypothetical protein